MSFLDALGAAALVLLGVGLFMMLAFFGLLALFLLAEAFLDRGDKSRRRDD